jgi:BlaI family transcriptional regulator, penicillinase repressor
MDAAKLSRRERQIMEILYRRESGTVEEVRREMSDPPGYSAVRATLGILEGKGYLRHASRGSAYVYSAVTPRTKAMKGAVKLLLRTYFDDSVPKAVSALIELKTGDFSPKDLRELEMLIRKKRGVP